MVRVIEEVGADNVGLQCDIYHTVMMGDDPAAILGRPEFQFPVCRHGETLGAVARSVAVGMWKVK